VEERSDYFWEEVKTKKEQGYKESNHIREKQILNQRKLKPMPIGGQTK